MIYTVDYDFYDEEEEIVHGDGSNSEFTYSMEIFTGGITLCTDVDDNIIKWYGYGGFEYEVGEAKTIQELLKFINEKYAFIDDDDRKAAVDELIEIIQVNIDRNYQNCFNDQFKDSMDALKRLGV